MLWVAYRRCLINGGAPGIDGQTFEGIEEYGQQRWLDELAEELRTKGYQPSPVKRVWIPKPEPLAEGANPRFVVTSLSAERVAAASLYEERYCARDEMENRIKEQQMYLFADRTSTHNMRSNQLRLLFSTMAYLLHLGLRAFGLAGTEMAIAQASTIRTKLLKIGGRLRVSVRRVWLSLSEAYPYQELFERILLNLQQQRPPPEPA